MIVEWLVEPKRGGSLGQVTTLRADHLYRWRSIANFPCSMFAVADIVQLLENNGFTEIEVVTSATSSARAEVEALTPPWPADRIKMNIQPGKCGFWGQARWSGPDAPLDLSLFQGIPSVQAVDFWDQTTTPPTAIIGPPFAAVTPPVICAPDEFFSTTENRCVKTTPPGPVPPPPAPPPPPPPPVPTPPTPPATAAPKKSAIPVVIGVLTVGALLVAAVAGRPSPPVAG